MPKGTGYPDFLSSNEDLASKMDVLGAAVDKRAARAAKETDETEVPPGEMPPDAANETIQPLMDLLGLSAERAQEILDAAQTLAWLKDMSPEELAKHLSENADDMQAVMGVAARKQDAAAETTVEEPQDVPGATI